VHSACFASVVPLSFESALYSLHKENEWGKKTRREIYIEIDRKIKAQGEPNNCNHPNNRYLIDIYIQRVTCIFSIDNIND
jgi:hypothetical protein